MVEIDRRIVPGEDPDGCMEEIQRILDEALDVHPGVTARVGAFLTSRAFLTPPESPVVRALRQAVTETRGPTVLTGYRQSSDARFFVEDGIPIVIFGPSDPEVGHAFNEHVAVAELEDATDILVRFARNGFLLG
jgi:acetylornithine deacetylase/succinyl-diaminopimelate desuccinylase-like protein